MEGAALKRWTRSTHSCEHIDQANGTGQMEQCEDEARWRVCSAIKVIMGNYCDQHLPHMWPGWRKDRL